MDAKKRKQEQEEADQRSSPSGAIVYKAIFKEACDELERPLSALFWSGVAAGLSMGASLVAEGLLASLLPNAPWTPLISKFGYCMGFLIVILGRQQLFTENTLTPMLPLLQEKTWQRLGSVARLCGVVLLSNLLGALAVAWACSKGSAFSPEARHQFSLIGLQAIDGSFGSHLVHGVFAGWLIALMVWMLPFAESARFWVIIVVSYVVGLGHFSHIVAGAVQTFYVAVTGEASWADVAGRYLAPTLLGNVIGGTALVAAINHAQIVSGKNRDDLKQSAH
ncbi:MAG TPA: formate/nitrite transporter family protein [Verrucomicrobiae bacterium]|jgi:formate/nitrite transporter FocA (FNT family)|nr:formate/nitrite transporter family protein [Verrucomicrobiae bacterium]